MSVKMSREYYERQIQEAREALMALDHFGEDDFENDAVLLFRRTFDGNNTVYTYAAVKTSGVWSITGRDSSYFFWDALVEQHLSKADEVWMATEWEEL